MQQEKKIPTQTEQQVNALLNRRTAESTTVSSVKLAIELLQEEDPTANSKLIEHLQNSIAGKNDSDTLSFE